MIVDSSIVKQGMCNEKKVNKIISTFTAIASTTNYAKKKKHPKIKTEF